MEDNNLRKIAQLLGDKKYGRKPQKGELQLIQGKSRTQPVGREICVDDYRRRHTIESPTKHKVSAYCKTYKQRTVTVEDYDRPFNPRGKDKIKNNPNRRGPYLEDEALLKEIGIPKAKPTKTPKPLSDRQKKDDARKVRQLKSLGIM